MAGMNTMIERGGLSDGEDHSARSVTVDGYGDSTADSNSAVGTFATLTGGDA